MKIIRFDYWPWKKHWKSFVSIIGFEKNIKNRSFRLLALKKTSKFIHFDYYKHRPGLHWTIKIVKPSKLLHPEFYDSLKLGPYGKVDPLKMLTTLSANFRKCWPLRISTLKIVNLLIIWLTKNVDPYKFGGDDFKHIRGSSPVYITTNITYVPCTPVLPVSPGGGRSTTVQKTPVIYFYWFSNKFLGFFKTIYLNVWRIFAVLNSLFDIRLRV